MPWKPQSEKDVWPGQDWEFPDGEKVHVGALVSDSMERHALCTYDDGGVLHIPASVLFATAKFVGSR